MAQLSWTNVNTGDPASWTAIEELYSRLNAISAAHEQGTIPVPSTGTGSKAMASDIAAINNKIINSLRTESHLAGASYTAVSNPSIGTLIKPELITQIQTNLDNMWGLCHHTPNSNRSNDSVRGDFGTGGFGEYYH